MLVGGQLLVWGAVFWQADGLAVALFITFLSLLVARLFLHGNQESPRNWLRDVSVAVLVVVWIPACLALAALLATMENPWSVDPRLAIVTLVAGVVANDVGGFVAGVFFGKHPMAPRVSPKKSWKALQAHAGRCGHRYCRCNLACWMPTGGMVQSWVWGWAPAATLGDLVESQFKRRPGHLRHVLNAAGSTAV